jgi:arylsulfatase A-like enzyme
MLRRLLDSPATYFVGAGVLFVLAVASQVEVRLPAREVAPATELAKLRDRDDLNVVFVLIDTLRADRLGSYGYERDTSPIIDSLGSSGVVFDRVVSQSSWTKSSMASLWTGTNPANNGVLRYKHALPAEAKMPAEIFSDAGIRTAGIWRNGWVAPNFGFDQGFDMYVRPKPGQERAQIQRNTPGRNPLQGTDEDLLNSAAEFLDTFGHDRFFLYLHFMDVHQYLFDEEAAKFGTSYSDAYDQAINWTDRLVGALVGNLADMDLLDRTLIVIASDHGEAFQEHGFEGHARNLHREVVYVPLILSLPFLLEPGVRVDSTVANVDVLPTILDIMGLPALPNADGRSLLPLIEEAAGVEPSGPTDGLERPIYSQIDRRWGRPSAESDPLVGVTDGTKRFFLPIKHPENASLFDWETDPAELDNLIETDTATSESMRALADAYLEGATSPWGVKVKEVELDALRLEQLRALGYVVGQ